MNRFNLSISFCTVCMNRLHHLIQTLPYNINGNQKENVEFVLLDYNSSDDLENYVRNTLASYISSGILKYYKTRTPQYFNRSHSRNLMFKLANGNIISNVDADNFIGRGFANYVEKHFKENENAFLTSLSTGKGNVKGDTFGRICLKKEDFYKIGGYDEKINLYGFEDYDFANRLEQTGLLRKKIASRYCKAIDHDIKERLVNEIAWKETHSILVCYVSPICSRIIFLFNNLTLCHGTLINRVINERKNAYQPIKTYLNGFTLGLVEKKWQKGSWSINSRNINANIGSNYFTIASEYDVTGQKTFRIAETGHIFYQLTSEKMIAEYLMLYSQLSTMAIMEDNKIEQGRFINSSGFGRDIVYKNFDYSTPLKIE